MSKDTYFYQVLGIFLFTLSGCAVPVGYVASGFVPEDELKVVRYMNKGVSEFSRSRFVEAEALFTEALVLAPGNRSIGHNLALTHSRMGAYSEAEKSLRNLLSTTTDEVERVNLYFELGNLFAAQLQFEKSLAFLEMALERHDSVTSGSEVVSTPEQGTQGQPPVKEIPTVEKKLVDRLVILEALLEAAIRSGEFLKARCLADDTISHKLGQVPVDYKSLLRTIKALNSMGFSDEARSHILHSMPRVLIERNAAIAHTLALTYLESGNFEDFIKWESSASVAFDSDETTKAEIDYLSALLVGSAGGQDDSGESTEKTLGQELKSWPPGIRLMQIDVDQYGDESAMIEIYQEVGKTLEEARKAARAHTTGTEPVDEDKEQGTGSKPDVSQELVH